MTDDSAAQPLLAIFDHDGVLVDSLELHQHAWLELGRRAGLPITAQLIRDTFGMTNPRIFELLFGEVRPSAELHALSELKESCYRDLARGRVVLMDGVRAVLDELTRHGVLLGIGSSAVRANLDLTVAECGLLGRFASIASLEDVERGKPDPQVFLLAAHRAGVSAARAVVFEDAPVGIRAAKAAGMRAIGVETTHPAATLFEVGATRSSRRWSITTSRRWFVVWPSPRRGRVDEDAPHSAGDDRAAVAVW